MLVVPVVAFGVWHRRTAERYCLPSLIPQAAEVEARIIVYTDRPGQFAGFPVEVINLRRKARPEIKHRITTDCYRHALRLGHPIVTAAADMICADRLLKSAERLAARNAVVLCPVLRCEEQRLGPWLTERNCIVSPRELFAAASGTIHQRQEYMFWDNLRADVQPTMILRRSPGAIMARCFHSHPIVIAAGARIGETISIDGEFLGTVPTDRIHVVTDSDEMMVVDLCSHHYSWDGNGRWRKPEKWVRQKTNAVHRWTFGHECVLHGDTYDVEAPPAGYLELCGRLKSVETEKEAA